MFPPALIFCLSLKIPKLLFSIFSPIFFYFSSLPFFFPHWEKLLLKLFVVIDTEYFQMLETYLVITLFRHEDCITSNCLEWCQFIKLPVRSSSLLESDHSSLSVSLLYLIHMVQRGFIHSLFQPYPLLDSTRPMGKKRECFVTALFILSSFNAVEGEIV